MKNILYLFIALIFTLSASAQESWVDLMTKSNSNFYDIQHASNEYFKDKDVSEKGNGYKAYKRWEYFVESRVYPSGDLSLLDKTSQNFEAFLKNEALQNNASANKFSNNNSINASTWTAIGPMGAMTGLANGLPRKAGRDNFITFHPTIANTFWVGAPAGGLWKTTNNGASWTTLTDNLGVIGCSDLAIDPTNTNIMYLATGDGDAGDTRSIGVLKSTDGGTTWNTTGLTYGVASNFRIRRLIINPSNTQILLAATSSGIYRTTNGGTNWTQELNANTYDVEFKPTDPTIIYATSNTAFYRSTDSGNNFTMITNGIASTGANRLAVAVTTADANYVYVLRSNTSSAFGGLYRSIDNGVSFSLMSTSPNILGNSCNGSSTGGQGWYDLALGASPLNKNIIVVGGVNHYHSNDGGASWVNTGCWNSTVSNPPYVHADVHGLSYRSDGTLFSVNDGGTYIYTGSSWTDITAPRNIAQIYRIGTSALTANRFITGHQDNGSNLYTGSAYIARYAGDGMDCFIDWSNDNKLYAETYNGNHVRSTDGGNSWTGATSGITQGGNWVTPWKQDPTVSTTIYSGRTAIWKSTNSGASYTSLTATGGSGAIIEFAIAPSNNQVIYAMHSTSLRKTTDGGATWSNVTSTIPFGSAAGKYIAIHPTNPNMVWVVLGSYSNGNKVFKTTNGGTSWTNISTNLPNIPANCIVYEPGSNDRVYVGMDVGVYHLDNSTTNWSLYNTGLPNTPVFDMEISPALPGKIRAATYGRGVWEVDVFSALPPVTTFSTSATTICTNNNIQFNSTSVNSASTWTWSTSPSAGVTINTANSQNPTFNFTNAGPYVITLQASNSSGPGNITNQGITVVAGPNVNVTNPNQTVCANNTVTFTASGASSYVWSNGGGSSSSAVYTPAATTVYSVTGTTGSCSNIKTVTVTTNALPNVAISSANSVCFGSSILLTATGANTYTWNTSSNATSINVSPVTTTNYTVTGTNASGCKNSFVKVIIVTPLPTITPALSSSVLCSGETATLSATGGVSYTWNPGNLVGNNVIAAPSSNTTYTVTGTDNVGCTNTSTINLIVSSCTGVVKLNGENIKYHVYPNPSKDLIYLNINTSTAIKVGVSIMDASGKLIATSNLQFSKSNTAQTLNISSVATGIYYVKLTVDNGDTKLIKLVKE